VRQTVIAKVVEFAATDLGEGRSNVVGMFRKT
jgi:hypothetical protein